MVCVEPMKRARGPDVGQEMSASTKPPEKGRKGGEAGGL